MLRCCPGQSSSALLEVHRCAKLARCCILASILSFCVCGMFSKILHFGYLMIRRKTPRGSCWIRQARKLPPTACGRMAKSARCCSPRPSRRFAKRVMEQYGFFTPKAPLHFASTRCGRFFCSLFSSCFLFFPCCSLLDVSRLFGLTLLPSAPVCFATGTPSHAGGWHLRRKRRVSLLLYFSICSFEKRCAL